MPRIKKTYTKVVFLKIPPQAHANLEGFLHRLTRLIKTVSASIRVEGDAVRISLSGDKASVMESVRAIEELVGEYTASHQDHLNWFKSSLLAEMTGSPVPLDVLSSILRLSGWDAVIEEQSIGTDAPYDVVVEYARKIVKWQGAISDIQASVGAQRLLLAASAYMDKDPRGLVKLAVEVGVLVKGRGGKLELVYSWPRALKELVRSTRHA